MSQVPLLSPDFIRRLNFMFEPLNRPRPLPAAEAEQVVLVEAARDWLERFLALLAQEREKLLAQALNPTARPSETNLLQPSNLPIPGWDWQAEPDNIHSGPGLFDPEIVQRAAYLVEQLNEDADQAFFRELALLTVDRFDLLASLLCTELERLNSFEF